MPNYKLSVSQRNHDKTGWHSSNQFQHDDINNIRVLNARNDKSLNAIPSPLARIHLFESAFSLVYQDELNGTNVSGDAYKKLVSDCFDVFELLFNWNNHIREGKDLKIIRWEKESEIKKLRQEFLEEKEIKEAELRRNQNENQSLNLQQIKGFKEHLVGDTLNLFLQSEPFSRFDEIYIIVYNNRPIAGTSPLTGFFTTPNDLSNINLVNPINKKDYFSREIPFSKRDSKIKKYVYDFFVKNDSVFPVKLPIRKYLENHSNIIGNATLKLDSINANEISIFNHSIILQSNSQKGASDYFERHLVRLNYRLNEDCFYVASSHKHDRKHDYLLPLTANFFEDFELSDVSSKVTINEKDANTVEVSIKNGSQIFSKTYQANRINEQDGYLIDLAGTHSIKIGLGIFPFLKVADNNDFNDFYRVMFVSQDNNYHFSNNDFKLNFGKDKNFIDPITANNYRIGREERTVLEKDKAEVGSTYYSLNFCFDFLQIELPQISEHTIKCMIVPKWVTKKLGSKQVDFAIDFGTTTTFVAYTSDPNRQNKPERFELNERQVPVALLNKPREKKPEWNWISCFEGYSLPDFFQFLEVQKQEFVPSLINSEKYSFPFRTVTYEKIEVEPNNKNVLSNANIAFSYQKEEDYTTNARGKQEYVTNLKWNVKTDSKYQKSVEVFIEELFHLLRIKTLLIDGNPKKSNISWFSPLSFAPGTQFTYNQIWSNKYSQIFKGTAELQLKNVTESEAPFYYYSKIMEDEGGAEGIEDTSSVMTIDIGGGTTDFMYFREGRPVIGTSVNFGANVLWGNAYSEFNSEKSNGIYLAIKNTISERLKSTGLKSLNEAFIKEGSPYGSDEIINFWIWNNDKTGVINELNKGTFKFSYLLHLSSLIYHSYKLIQFQKYTAPKCIIFTGNGSKYLDLIQTKDFIQKICGFFVKELFGSDEKIPQVILPPSNRKEATCFGGLYQPFGAQRQFSDVNYLGFESQTDNFKKYSDLDLQKEKVFKGIGASFEEFINCFFKMNESQDLSFKRTFDIDLNLDAVKTYMLTKAQDNLSTGYEKRRKLVDSGDVITDSLFFYPIVGLVYQINKLTKDKLGEYIPRSRYFALSPDDDAIFEVSRLSTHQKPDSIFLISIDDTNPDFGEIIIIEDSSANKRAMAGMNTFLKSVCEFEEFPDNVNQSIHVIEAGHVAKENETGKWTVTKRIKIEFVS
jgi:hypothetical protein